jgi:cytochrome c oxidase subunit 2
MGKFFAATIFIIAIASAVPILMHTWPMPIDISTHGPLIDEQMASTMAEAGIAFLAAQILLAAFIWIFSSRPKDAKIGHFPGGSLGLVVAALLLVGTEVLALGVFGTKAWAAVYFTPPAADSMPIQVQAGQFAFYFRYPGPDGKLAPIQSNHADQLQIEARRCPMRLGTYSVGHFHLGAEKGHGGSRRQNNRNR